MRDVFDLYANLVVGRPNMLKGTCQIDLLPTTCHVYFGEVMGASANTRPVRTVQREGNNS